MNATDRPSSKYNNSTNWNIGVRTMIAHLKNLLVWLTKSASPHFIRVQSLPQCQSNFNSNIELNSNEMPIHRFEYSIQREAVSMIDLNNK